MKILIIHDRAEAVGAIREVVEAGVSGHCEITVARDGSEARRYLSRSLFDLVIVDLTIPHISGRSEVDYRTANDLLEELFHVGTFIFPGDVIGITADLQALSAIQLTVGKHLMAIIEETEDGVWRSLLSDKVQYCAMVSNNRQRSLLSNYDYDVLILTALDEELRPILANAEASQLKHFEGASEFVFSDSQGDIRRGVAFAIGRSGQASAASTAQSLITFFRPKLALMIGFCAGIEGKAKKGDIVVFDTVYDWDYGKWYADELAAAGLGPTSESGKSRSSNGPAQFGARPRPIAVDSIKTNALVRRLLEDADAITAPFSGEITLVSNGERDRVNLVTGSAASGSAVVASTEIVNQIRMLSDSMKAIDMESYGFYHACANTKAVQPSFLCIKSVADWADHTKDDRFHEFCCKAAARIAFLVVEKYWSFD